MKIEIKDRDYTFHLTEGQLINLINNGSKLETTLFEQRFTLEGSTNLRSTSGIDADYLPYGASLGYAKQVAIKVGLGVLDRVRHGELVSARYDEHNCISICKYNSKW